MGLAWGRVGTVPHVRVGADSGGTFTDVVGAHGVILKIPSTPARPQDALRAGVAAVAGRNDVELFAHGTTVATNTLLERSGASVALITTAGLVDVIEIGRQARPSLYDLWSDRPEPLVPRHRRIELDERLDAMGTVVRPLDLDDLPEIADGVHSIAVCLLHADLEPVHERAVAEALRARGHDVSASHEVAPEFREYERTITTVVNAYLRPRCGAYLAGLSELARSVVVMSSAGGHITLDVAAATPAALLLSGPAAGVRAAAAVAVACGHPDAITFDMGGTSTDVCLVLGGEPAPAAVRDVAGLPIRLPSLDVHTIGSGGGSIASIDGGGALQVGPISAGADPGPACYGRGGQRPTVTDANLLLGRLPADSSFPGLGQLDTAAAADAFARDGIDPAGVISVVDAQMEQALRAVSVERGIDPSGLALVAFGGAGPLHACGLAASMGITTVIVPGAAGVLSAVGLLAAPVRRDLVRSRARPADHEGLHAQVEELTERVRALLAGDTGAAPASIEVSSSFDCRYEGQSHELRVASVAEFGAAHEQLNGYGLPGRRIEVTAVRATAELPAQDTVEQVLASWDDRQRDDVVGPEVLVRDDCTMWVPPGWRGRPGPLGSWVLRPGEAE